jgi:cytochrome c556
MKYFLPTQQKYAYKFGEKSAKMIELYVNDLNESIKAKNTQDALEDYNQILRQCNSCHIRLRK